jgi:Zn-dependent protease
MDVINIIFAVIVLVMSVIAHELAHGYAAEWLGDPTARLQGRLTINPVKHVDPLGSLLVPLVSYTLGGFIFGWAKPVPYNPYNLKGGRYSEAVVAGAGALTNILLAVVFALIIRILGPQLPDAFIALSSLVVITNIVLAIFNLIPVPPLDGSKVLFSFLPFHMSGLQRTMEQWGLPLVLFFALFLWQFIVPVIGIIFSFLTGIRI